MIERIVVMQMGIWDRYGMVLYRNGVMVKKGYLQLVILIASVSLNAAIPQNTDSIINILERPLRQRVAQLKNYGQSGIQKLYGIAFDKNQTVKIRWKALMTLVYIGQKESLPIVRQALRSSEWFMRDAGLKAISKISQSDALVWARRLLTDSSLIVRTSAVAVIRRYNDEQSAEVLWKGLYAPQNYRGQQSLWVRRHIVEALANMELKGQESKFLRVLDDRDKSLHQPAIKGLEKLTGFTFSKKYKSVGLQKNAWKKWWAESSQTQQKTL